MSAAKMSTKSITYCKQYPIQDTQVTRYRSVGKSMGRMGIVVWLFTWRYQNFIILNNIKVQKHHSWSAGMSFQEGAGCFLQYVDVQLILTLALFQVVHIQLLQFLDIRRFIINSCVDDYIMLLLACDQVRKLFQ